MPEMLLKEACGHCPVGVQLQRMGLKLSGEERVIALAGNPNTGKSTVFNALTGLKQHTGNWPGKTVTRAEGGFVFNGQTFKLVDLPGTYSLLSASSDEEVARDFILFGQPDCTIVVVDATALERNLNLVLQVLEISDRVVVCLNLMDEAARKGIAVDLRHLSMELGVPVVGTTAKTGKGIHHLMEAVENLVEGNTVTDPRPPQPPGKLKSAVESLAPAIESLVPGLPNARWVAYRLIEGDHHVRQAMQNGELLDLVEPNRAEGSGPAAEDRIDDAYRAAAESVLQLADSLRPALGERFRDELVGALYRHANDIAERVTSAKKKKKWVFEDRIDHYLTHPWFGLPLMLLILAVVFWLTVTGANVPSYFLASVLIEKGGLNGFFGQYFGIAAPAFLSFSLYELLHLGFAALSAPAWLSGFLIDGVYLGLCWVVSVMLPPMAIFFPLFTMLEDLGYLPRVAFNLDWLFKMAGAHGKQALTMSMGFGCNVAGIISARIIDSPREKLIAILTNNFVPCNGRFPTLIAISSLFVAASFSPVFASLAAAGAMIAIVLLGILFTLLVSWALSHTVLKGEASAFTLELPPYRRPGILRILYTSLIDRTIFVLLRACMTAAPAGGIIWLLANNTVGGVSLANHAVAFLNPFGWALGLDGVIILAYIIAIPANEIVVPTMLMLYLNHGMMIEEEGSVLRDILVNNHWTLLTAVCLMLFCLLHNPCGTTIWTMWKETRSLKWTVFGALMPLAIGILTCASVAGAWRLFH